MYIVTMRREDQQQRVGRARRWNAGAAPWKLGCDAGGSPISLSAALDGVHRLAERRRRARG
jgi:hypothetical protein